MWTYAQATGDLFFNSDYVETGYSGANPSGKNDPSKECQRNVGPIPRGRYSIGPEVNSPSPVALPLKADNQSYCSPPRSGFLIHGDNSSGTASTGCIIMSRRTRERIRDSGDARIRVVKETIRSAGIKRRRFAESVGL